MTKAEIPPTQIVLIDDDPIVGLILKRTLLGQGYSVNHTQDGVEGLQMIHQLRPSLVICDWMMPSMDGIEVCRQVKSDPKLSNTIFLLLTSRSEIADRVVGLDAGADDFLAKPIDPAELRARVRAGLRLHQMAQELQQQKQRLESELNDAAEYVRSLLPPPIKTEYLCVNSRFYPSIHLSGDFFDYYWLDSESLVLYLLDVSGHGVKAALLSVSIQNILRNRSLPNVSFDQPNQVLSALNRIFDMELNSYQYFTIWYGVLHVPSREITYSSAGHPPAILIDSINPEQVSQLKNIGIPIGFFPESQYSNAHYTVKPHDVLYLLSDGIYELSQNDGSVWTINQFIDFLSQNHCDQVPSLDKIFTELDHLVSSDTELDDRSLVQLIFY